jgi:acyl transferase domain-containing protein
LNTHRDIDMDNLSRTLAEKRSTFEWRAGVIAKNISSLISGLATKEMTVSKAKSRTANVFVFTGQGAQWAKMGYKLVMGDTEFSQSIHRSDQQLQKLGCPWSLVEEPSRGAFTRRRINKPEQEPIRSAMQYRCPSCFG